MSSDIARRLTVLTSLGIRAVKTFTKGKDGEIHEEGYGRAKTFTAEETEILDERGRWLRRLTKKENSFVVMGRPVDWKPGEKKRRLSTERDGHYATLEDVPRLIMPFDIDQVDFESIGEIDDGEMYALEVLDRLGLKGIGCLWQLTGSHGINGKRRIRLWVTLEKPATCAQMLEYVKQRWGNDLVEKEDGKKACIVDMSVYRPAQPIYVGAPILIGFDDPVEERTGRIEGELLRFKVSTKAPQGPSDDENVELLKEHELYIRQLRPGQHAIICPWESAHSGPEKEDDSCYFEPHYNGHDIPAFKCLHGHCVDKRWSDVLDELGIKQTVFSPVDDDDDTPPFVFIHRMKRFWDSRDGALYDREVYDSMHGGVSHKKGPPTQRFLVSNKTSKVDTAEFLPGENRIVRRGKIKVLNMFVDTRIAPDASVDSVPFVEHMRWMIPNEAERNHLLDWMAWVYTNPGQKILWAPILYGPPGTGKTTVMNILADLIGRRYMSEPMQSELEDKFTDWAYGKILVKIEELRSEDKFHVAEKLKPIVANLSISIRRMHETGFSVTNVANVIASTNHMEALPIERGDRRYMFLRCCDPVVTERQRHMKVLHLWLSRVGLAGIASFMAKRDLSRFKPASEAPMTELKKTVIEASKTEFERAIDIVEHWDKEAIVTSTAMHDILEENRCLVPPRRLGLVAARRGWYALDGAGGRTRHNNRKVTLWSPKGSHVDIRKVLDMDSALRNAFLSRVNEKLLSGKTTFSKVNLKSV